MAVLDRAGAALATERDLTSRLGALVAVGEQARVGIDDAELLRETMEKVRPAYGDVKVGLLAAGTLVVDGRRYEAEALQDGPMEKDGRLAYPLTVKGRLAGVLEAPSVATDDPRRALLDTLASQLSIALENARLYRELGTLFRQYLSPDVAAALLADPDQAALGGELVEVTALFADLRGFTTFSEGVEPGEIVQMLNRYHAVDRSVHSGQWRHRRAVRRRRAAGPVQRARAAARPRAAGGPRRARDAGGGRPDRRRAIRTGRASGSAPTPGRRWSATSAASRCAASTRWATRSTWRRACRRSPSPARW